MTSSVGASPPGKSISGFSLIGRSSACGGVGSGRRSDGRGLIVSYPDSDQGDDTMSTTKTSASPFSIPEPDGGLSP